MTYREVEGDLFEMGFPALGHGCNCQGVMGAGIASVFAKRWPKMVVEYRQFCQEGDATPGDFYPYPADGVMIYNLLTQVLTGADAKVEYIQTAVAAAIEDCKAEGISTLAIPRIGCGIGGLRWADVRPALQEIMLSKNTELVVVTLPPRPPKAHPDTAHLSSYAHPYLKVLRWEPGSSSMVMGASRGVTDPQDADLITSRIHQQSCTSCGNTGFKNKNATASMCGDCGGPFQHTIMLDLDVPATLVPSTTEGHSHLYIDVPLTWSRYTELLRTLGKLGIIEGGYMGASISRGYTSLRLPWVKKENLIK
jgi:O-acetyl-ADP-ribose deacetylase (regulator of RNase III)